MEKGTRADVRMCRITLSLLSLETSFPKASFRLGLSFLPSLDARFETFDEGSIPRWPEMIFHLVAYTGGSPADVTRADPFRPDPNDVPSTCAFPRASSRFPPRCLHRRYREDLSLRASPSLSLFLETIGDLLCAIRNFTRHSLASRAARDDPLVFLLSREVIPAPSERAEQTSRSLLRERARGRTWISAFRDDEFALSERDVR